MSKVEKLGADKFQYTENFILFQYLAKQKEICEIQSVIGYIEMLTCC